LLSKNKCTEKKPNIEILASQTGLYNLLKHEGQFSTAESPAWDHALSFHDQMTQLVERERLWMFSTWTLVKTFDTVPHSILVEKLAAHGLDGCMLCWVKKWLNG